MLTPKVLNICGRSINYAYFFYSVPIYWNWKTQNVCLTTSKFRLWTCIFQLCILITVIFIILERSILFINKTFDDPMICMLFLIAGVSYSLAASISVLVVLKADELVFVTNHVICLFKTFEEKYLIQDGTAISNGKSNPLERTLTILFILCAINPLIQQGATFLVFLNPHRIIYYTSILNLPFELTYDQSIILLMIMSLQQLAIINFVMCNVLVLMIIIIAYFYESGFILQEINPSIPGNSNTNTIENTLHHRYLCKSPSPSLFYYKCLLITSIEINDMIKYLNPIIIFLIMVLNVICNIFIILFLHEDIYSSIAIFMPGLLTTFAQSEIYYKIGLFHKHSLKWKIAWKTTTKTQLMEIIKPLDRKLIKKYINSCYELRLNVGYWGCIKTITSLNVIGKMI